MRSIKKQTLVIFLLGIYILLPVVLSISCYTKQVHPLTPEIITEVKPPSTSAVHKLSYIHIVDNWTATVAEDWCSGNGSFSNPYTIENVIINATNAPVLDPLPDSDFQSGIFIGFTNDYFVIKNCTVFTSDPNKDIYGIWLYMANNGTLSNNNFSNCKTGIFLYQSQNCIITGNTANNNT